LHSELKIIDVPDGGIVTVSENRHQIALWNETSAFIITSLIDQSPTHVARILSEHFNISFEKAFEDVLSVVKALECQNRPLLKQEPAAVANFDTEFKQEHKYFDLDNCAFKISAPRAVMDKILALWSHRECGAVELCDKINITLYDFENGKMTLNGVEKIDSAPIHVLLGGVYQQIIETLHSKETWSAFIHAAAVSKNEKAIILAAKSGSGKSTLTAMLVNAGYDYQSDDMVPVTFNTHNIAPFPLPITVKPGAAKVLANLFKEINAKEKTVTQHIICKQSFRSTLPHAKALVFPKFVRNAETVFETVSVAKALTLLFEDRIHFGYPANVERIQDFVGWLSSVPRKTLVYSNFYEAEKCLSSLIQN
jgi:hypothetical protein